MAVHAQHLLLGGPNMAAADVLLASDGGIRTAPAARRVKHGCGSKRGYQSSEHQDNGINFSRCANDTFLSSLARSITCRLLTRDEPFVL